MGHPLHRAKSNLDSDNDRTPPEIFPNDLGFHPTPTTDRRPKTPAICRDRTAIRHHKYRPAFSGPQPQKLVGLFQKNTVARPLGRTNTTDDTGLTGTLQ
jgi:hypothetical protein